MSEKKFLDLKFFIERVQFCLYYLPFFKYWIRQKDSSCKYTVQFTVSEKSHYYELKTSYWKKCPFSSYSSVSVYSFKTLKRIQKKTLRKFLKELRIRYCFHTYRNVKLFQFIFSKHVKWNKKKLFWKVSDQIFVFIRLSS